MNFEFQRRGLLCVVSGPSGSGKTTLCRKFSNQEGGCTYAISCTTRQPRTGEEDGLDYFFLTREAFESRATRGDFLEWAEVHGNLYGTLKSEVLRHIKAGTDVLMDIDVQGAELVRRSPDSMILESLVDVFILLSEDELLKRLGGRGTETPEQLELRRHNARDEMRHWRDYRWAIESGTQEADFDKFRAILQGERCRTHRMIVPTDDVPTATQGELSIDG